MARGRLSVYCENTAVTREVRKYRSNFAEYGGEHGAQTSRVFIGTDALRSFLIAIQDPTMKTESPEDRADEWLRDLHSNGNIEWDDIELTEAHAQMYRRTA